MNEIERYVARTSFLHQLCSVLVNPLVPPTPAHFLDDQTTATTMDDFGIDMDFSGFADAIGDAMMVKGGENTANVHKACTPSHHPPPATRPTECH